MQRQTCLWYSLISITIFLLANLLCVNADDIDCSGTWKFAGTNARAVFYQEGNKVTGHFESSDGRSIWEIEGTVNEDGKVSLIRFISKSELIGNGLPGDMADIVIGMYPTRKPGFMRGDVELKYDEEKDTLSGYYLIHSALWNKTLSSVDKVDEKPIRVVMTREFSRADPACCDKIDFACSQLPDPTERERCERLQAEARQDCRLGDYFHTDFASARAAEDAGIFFERTVTFWVGDRAAAVVRRPDGEGFTYGIVSKRRPLLEREVWDVTTARSLSEDELEILAYIAAGDGHFMNSLTRLWKTSREMAEEYLEGKFKEMIDECLNGKVVVVANPVLAGILRGYYEVTGLPTLADDLDAVGELGGVVTDPEADTSHRFLAAALVGGVVVGEVFDIPTLKKTQRELTPALRRQVRQLDGEIDNLRRQVEVAEGIGEDATGLRRSLEEAERLRKTFTETADQIEESVEAFNKANAPSQFHPDAPEPDLDDWVPGPHLGLAKLGEAYEDQAKMLRDELEKFESQIRRLEAGLTTGDATDRDVVRKMLDKIRDKQRLYAQNLQELDKVRAHRDKYGIRHKLEGIIERKPLSQLRDEVLDETVPPFNRILASEELGMHASRQYSRQAFGTDNLPDGFGTQIHGPDWATTVRRGDQDVHVLLEAKSRTGAFDPNNASGPLTPEAILSNRKRSGAPQHSPEDTRFFAKDLANKAKIQEGHLRDQLSDMSDQLSELTDIQRRTEIEKSITEIEKSIKYYEDKQEYWRAIADQVNDRKRVELHTIIFDPASNEYRAWIWNGKAWVPNGTGKLDYD